MITQEEYLQAKKIVDDYNKQLDLYIFNKRNEILNAKRGDYLIYIGGSDSKNLIKGEKYRLTCEPFRDRVAIINETGKRQVYKNKLFVIS